MNSLIALTAAAAAAATLAAIPANASTALATSSQQAQQVASVRHGISWARSRTWHWQDIAQVHRSPATRGVAMPTHSVGYLHWVEHRWNRRRVAAYRLAHHPRAVSAPGGSVQTIICRVFGGACGEALAVARCESGFSTAAVNGQYLGIFQMGSNERATYATSGYSTAYEQIVAAHNYYAVAGWGPWSCA